MNINPKEQTLELIDSFIQASVVNEDGTTWHHPKPYTMAVQCALKEVDVILEVLDKGRSVELHTYLSDRKHWELVKKELEENKWTKERIQKYRHLV